MSNFIRNLRRLWLSENRFSKYLVYAIGEIILVVIGILIALQINEWNERRQHHQEENRILLSLKKDLINDTLQLTYNIITAKDRTAQIDSVYIALSNPHQFTSGKFLRMAYTLASSNEFNVNSGTFDESLSSGFLKYIRNDLLRQQIFEYYRISKLNENDKYATQQKFDVVFPTMFKTLSTSKDFFDQFIGHPSAFKQLDIESLSRNIEFIAAVNQRYSSEKNQIQHWHHFITMSKSLIFAIETELEISD
ncbi:MAG: hypothetical protein H6570_03235 [Lewinellaceae bacterium]|nr:hypothetical protein [Lewinellaceae bacterium]